MSSCNHAITRPVLPFLAEGWNPFLHMHVYPSIYPAKMFSRALGGCFWVLQLFWRLLMGVQRTSRCVFYFHQFSRSSVHCASANPMIIHPMVVLVHPLANHTTQITENFFHKKPIIFNLPLDIILLVPSSLLQSIFPFQFGRLRICPETDRWNWHLYVSMPWNSREYLPVDNEPMVVEVAVFPACIDIL